MRVLFVYSVDNVRPHGKPLRSWSDMQHGISYISSLLKVHDHETSLVVLGSTRYRQSVEILQRVMDDFAPTLICFTSVYSQFAFIESVARFVREHTPQTYILAGGVHATLQPEAAVQGPFDAICVGEGEFPVLELCVRLEAREPPHGIPNLWIKSSGSVEKNQPREFLQDLDVLPFPDYDMWKPWIEEPSGDVMTVFAGRGCPYDCTYCSNHALRGVAKGRYVRTRLPERIAAEVAFLHANFPHREIYFEIETLDCNVEWTKELCRHLAEFNASVDDPVVFGSNYRINPGTIEEGLFSALAEANFSSINIGLESGSERLRSEVLKRSYTNDDFLKVVGIARKHRLQVFVYNMIGLPGETLEDLSETVRMNRLCQPDGHHTGIFYPYPGTELYDFCVTEGLMERSAARGRERRQPVLNLPGFPGKRVKSAYVWFDYHVYRGRKPLWRILVQVALVWIDATPASKSLCRSLLQLFRRLRCIR